MTQSNRMKMIALAVLPVLVAAGCAKKDTATSESAQPAPMEEASMAQPMTAKATLTSRADMTVSGMVTFSQEGDVVTIIAHIEGAPPGVHGFHIHEIGDCSSEDFKSAGGHFNPTDTVHGGPQDAERHAGDLGNVEIGENGSAHLELSSNLISLGDGPNAVIGRGVILHADADDLVSQPTGAAGARLACGVIEEG